MATRETNLIALRAFLVKVSWTLVVGAVIVIVALFTPWGIVRSSDLASKVEAAVKGSALAKSVEEIKLEQQAMKAKLDLMSPMLMEVYKASTAQTICRLLENKLRDAADKEQDKYKVIAGEFYPESRCGGK